MLGKRLLSMVAAGSCAAMVGCADANVGSTQRDMSGGAGTSGPAAGSGGLAASGTGGTGATAGSGGTSAASGSGGMSGAAGSGGGASSASSGSGGDGSAGQSPGTGGSADLGSGGTGSGGMGSGGTGSGGTGSGGANGTGGTGDQTPVSQTCANPAHVLPLNPQDPQDGITLSGFYVDTDTWNAASYDVSQTMYICDYNNWYVVANMNNDTGDGAVKTYPNVHQDFNDAPMISSFSTITSSFAHTAPHVGIYEFAYDIWLNGVASSGSTEVMIWTDNYGQVPSGSALETVTFDGRDYEVHKSGSYIAFVDTGNVTSGTVNLLSFFNHIIDQGWIPSTSTLGAIDYGIELVSTDGMDATFEVNDFSLVAN